MKIKGDLRLPNILESPLITREIEVDEKKYLKATDKDKFMQLSFLHAVSDEIEVKCEISKHI